ncbi:hypothetical protein J2Z62_000421 [Mycoplasmoides fastidiosum]|uniref:Uncharacterized protein n=1 Tax=Mycoplasmoides fastidiosum TaxID=92758 RepID=A0ABU0LZ54_9BACT|nr:hypothetical protein [Mycoplasmoides fastidiosum]MDQ0513983.1 hypothetical protein [Mycoplasmoides fastidiosum]UUD37603.1 hypothetical protein NPA10_03485 [Mycoplasmoides fastidiosum]
MKKFNLFKNNKLWLASLGIATTSSLVLAACASQNTNNSSNNTVHPENSKPTPAPDSGTIPQTPATPEVPKLPTATVEQKSLATAILNNSDVKAVLQETVNKTKENILNQIKTVTLLDTLNQDTVAQSIQALGKTEDPMAGSATASVVALIKTLEDNVTKADNNSVPTAQKDKFKKTLKKVISDADALLKTLNALPKKDDATKLADLEKKLETAVNEFVSVSAEAELTTKLEALLNAHKNYQTEVKVVTERLVNAEQKAFILDSSTSALEKYIGSEVATFLTGTDGKKHTDTLAHLTNQVRTGVLGTLGADLWTVGNISETVAMNNRPTSIQKDSKSDRLYKIVVYLAEQQFSWNQINSELKNLTYHQSLLLKLPSALNLLALHADVIVPVDVARLNAYLLNNVVLKNYPHSFIQSVVKKKKKKPLAKMGSV